MKGGKMGNLYFGLCELCVAAPMIITVIAHRAIRWKTHQQLPGRRY